MKKIALITNWYPTKENPYIGGFFKEQALSMANTCNFIVIHFTEKKKFFIIKPCSVKFSNIEANIKEYNIQINVPICLFVIDFINSYFYNRNVKKRIDGVGKYTSRIHKMYRNKVLGGIVRKKFEKKIDVAYCVDAQTEAAITKVIADSLECPYIVSEHAPVPWPGQLISDENKIAIEKANAFIAISNDKIKQMMQNAIKLPKIFYLGNMIDEKKFTLRSKKNGIKTILIVAANSFYKNYEMFITVMNRLTEVTKVPFNVMIVGYAANKGYSKNTSELEKKIRKSKFAKFTILIPEVSHDNIHRIYGSADVFVMTSVQEGQPVSALEAACCGLPIFSTRCGGVEDYVDERIGRIYGITEVEAFANGLKDYLEGRIVFEPEIIRNVLINKYGKEVFVEKFNNIIDYVLLNK